MNRFKKDNIAIQNALMNSTLQKRICKIRNKLERDKPKPKQNHNVEILETSQVLETINNIIQEQEQEEIEPLKVIINDDLPVVSDELFELELEIESTKDPTLKSLYERVKQKLQNI